MEPSDLRMPSGFPSCPCSELRSLRGTAAAGGSMENVVEILVAEIDIHFLVLVLQDVDKSLC